MSTSPTLLPSEIGTRRPRQAGEGRGCLKMGPWKWRGHLARRPCRHLEPGVGRLSAPKRSRIGLRDPFEKVATRQVQAGPHRRDVGVSLCRRSAEERTTGASARFKHDRDDPVNHGRDVRIARGQRARRGSLSRFRRHSERSTLNLNEQHYWAETAQQTTGETPVPLLLSSRDVGATQRPLSPSPAPGLYGILRQSGRPRENTAVPRPPLKRRIHWSGEAAGLPEEFDHARYDSG
jgi:hypothetical protein